VHLRLHSRWVEATSLAFISPALATLLDLPALDLEHLGGIAQAAEAALLRQGESENTLRSDRSTLRTERRGLHCAAASRSPCPSRSLLSSSSSSITLSDWTPTAGWSANCHR
jgi:hypothetical protein